MTSLDNHESIRHFQSLCDACQDLASRHLSRSELRLYADGYIHALRKSGRLDRKEQEKLENEKALEAELKGLRKINKNASPDVSTRMKHMITSVNGDSEKKTIREFVDRGLLARDARALRTYINEIQPDTDLTFEREASNGDFETLTIPITANFFWPDAEL